MALAPPLLTPANVGHAAILTLFALAQALLVLYSSHRYLTLWRWWRRAPSPPSPAAVEGAWPRVTVQLPLYNERVVAARLIEAVASLRYAPGRLEIQVLDDSTDETTAIAARAVEAARGRGVDIALHHRDGRDGFKAGALADGLARSRGELIAVFDADFVPPADFLERLVPHFTDPTVGMVQARWGHLNREGSLLTRAQAVMLDAHFLLEHRVRMDERLYFNFNGTAGVWRRAAIESAGGWSHDTLTEDLDLSYRAQLAGWRFVFDPRVVAEAELPADVAALEAQQRRWTRGSIQTARKVLPRLLAGAHSLALKLEAFVHLTSNVTYPLLLLLALLQLPVLLARDPASSWVVGTLQLAVIVFGLVPVSLFMVGGQGLAGRRGARVLGDVLAALVLGAGLALNNTRAVLGGLGPRLGAWERTPKSGAGGRASAAARYSSHGRVRVGEVLLAGYLAVTACVAAATRQWQAVPFVVLMGAGLAVVIASRARAAASGRDATVG
jgi:cellulose synthase/poly-beta-1,6-N-acetylglucosamine synthase-like glycosyltransferase